MIYHDSITILFFFQGDHVWLEPKTRDEFSVAIGARVKFTESGKVLVVDDDGKVRRSL